MPWIADALGVGSGKKVIDLGAGTGKFTKLLAGTGAEVLAVEPVGAMRAVLSRSLPQVRAVDGTAEAMPLATASVDALFCAQAFHWFATEAALSEIHRVIKPGGKLGLVWNVRDESVDWVAEITAIITPYEGDAPRYYKGDWRQAFRSGRWFSEPALRSFSYQHVGPPQQVIVDRFLSVSFIAALPSQEKAHVERRLRTLIADHPDLQGCQTLAFPYRTEAFCCNRLD